jgi:hypothetical protein
MNGYVTIMDFKMAGFRHGVPYTLLWGFLLFGDWLDASADAADSVVVFNEVQYQPADEVSQSEWIELRNLMGVTVDLSGWELSEGAGLVFEEGTRILGRGYLIVSTEPSDPLLAGRNVYPSPLVNRLANGGETLLLRNRSGRVMDRLNYDSAGDWPMGPTGSGATLTKRDEDSADSSSENWVSSDRIGGTPGRRNFPIADPKPLVTELVALDSDWRYLNSGTPAPQDWNERGFDSSDWEEGKGLFQSGYSEAFEGLSGLLGYWKLDEASGPIAKDEVSGLEGRLRNGVDWIDDRVRGSVLEFDGEDGFVQTGVSIPQLTLETDFTWAFWAFSRRPANTNVIVGNRYRANGADFSPREFIKFTNAGLEFHRLGAGEDIAYPAIPRNEWVHHAAVKLGARLSYYRNGEIQGTQNLSAGTGNPQPVYFGGDQAQENWRGRLDEVGLWEVALSEESVLGLANGTFSPDTAPAPDSRSIFKGTEFVDIGQTIYFSSEFSFFGKPSQTELSMELLVDDGAVVYLNGQEVHRVNVSDSPLNFQSPATAEVDRAEWVAPIALSSKALLSGRNVIAVEVHQGASSELPEDFVFGLSLESTELPGSVTRGNEIVFNEVSEGEADVFSLELMNRGADLVDVSLMEIRSSAGWASALPPGETLLPGEWLVLSGESFGRIPNSGERLFLVGELGGRLLDAVRVRGQLQARNWTDGGRWYQPGVSTFGLGNLSEPEPTIVINEVMYHPRENSLSGISTGQWIELFNRGAEPVDIGGWQFDDGVQFTFPSGSSVGPGQYLIVVSDQEAFGSVHSAVPVAGEWAGSLSGRGERVRLIDSVGNLIDEVRYFDGGRWPANADGRGSSLELRDPRADNRHPNAWSASFVEGPWQEISYRGLAKNGMSDPTQYNEFIFGLLNAGELLIDDISVVEDPDRAGRELIQNGSFESGGSEKWRLLGNHSRFEVIDDPTQVGNKVLRVTATGPTEHMSNHAETTLRFGNAYVSVSESREYEISFRVKWLGGSNQLNTRLYFNRLPETTLLKTGEPGGSPGAVNSTRVANLGPGLDDLSHSPVVPDTQEPILVRVSASDPDGIAGLTLNYAPRGRTFIRVPMDLIEGQWRAMIPGQSSGTKIQFFVEATDRRGAVSWLPAAGPSSSALIPIADGQADLDYGNCQPTNLRIVMSDADIKKLHESSNVMSNDRLGCTVIVDERLVYYDAGVRLKGSEHGRASDVRVGYNIRFPADSLFLGAHETIAVDRSGAGDQFSQREMMIKHAINHAGGIPGSYDDLIRVIAPKSQHTGAAMLSKARFDREFLVNQPEGDGSGTLFEYELIYVLTGTTGGVEGLKVTQSGEVRGVPPRNLGGKDKELYRWHWQMKNNRTSDDFSPLVEMVTALGRSGSRYQRDTDQLLDVDQWLRTFAVQVLFGIADNYSSGSRHNAMFYHRPSDGKMLYFPWDMDFTFVRAASSSLTPNDDQNRLIRASPRNKRNFYRHLWEIVQSTFNTDYLSEWANHYSCFLPTEDLNRFMPYVRTRSSFALGEIKKAIPQVPFSISTDNNFSTPSTMASIEGKGWLDVHEIRIADGETLSVEWRDTNTWRVSVPVRPGPNQIAIEAIDLHGTVIASDVVNLVGTGQVLPAGFGNLAVSEIMYHPADPSEDELAAGWLDAEVFEFIELINLSDEFSVDLGGIEFTEGIRYQFDNTLVRPGGRVLLVGNLEAFQTRYGRDLPVVGAYQDQDMNRLSNSGERLTLLDATRQEMVSLEWSDRSPWPISADGHGYSLLPVVPNLMDLSIASQWRSSATLGGNPASSDSVPLRDWMNDLGVEDFGNDLDNDGWDTVYEYIAGSEPWSAEEIPSVEVTFEETGEGEMLLVVNVVVAIGHDDVQIRPLLSSDLEEWSNEVAYAGRWNNGDGTATVRFRSEVPVSDRAAQFIQLGVVLWEVEGN